MNNKEFQRKIKTLSRSEIKIELMSINQYRSKIVQPVVNEIIRLIDYGQPCICRPNEAGTDAGHFKSVGSNSTLSLNFHNIHLQGRNSNGYKGGESLKYYKGLIRVYGPEYAEYCDQLSQCSPLKLTKDELKEARQRLLPFRLELKKNQKVNGKYNRLLLRNKANEIMNIYPYEFKEFTIARHG
jgi:hypothetical protein